MNKQSLGHGFTQLGLGLTAAAVLPAYPTEAAESVVLKYGFIRESVSVPELSTFVETGELSSSLEAYLKMANTEPEELRSVLTREIEIEPVPLSRGLNTLPGELLLDQVSKVIHTPTQSASQQSLRAALVSSALPDGNITLLEVLENYPTEDVHVEGDRLVETYTQLDKFLGILADAGVELKL
ncbi:MAG: alpha/beta hydrolase [Cyanophyceae cyanobacterium]